MAKHLNPQSGYIALTSVIIMSVLLITITAALSGANYFSRYDILENEFKQRSSDLAEACVNYAEGQVAGNPGYTLTSPGSVVVGKDSCTVVSVTPAGGKTAVITQGIYPKTGPERSYTNLIVVLNSNMTVNSWQETAN
jgi:hypothetical protein